MGWDDRWSRFFYGVFHPLVDGLEVDVVNLLDEGLFLCWVKALPEGQEVGLVVFFQTCF